MWSKTVVQVTVNIFGLRERYKAGTQGQPRQGSTEGGREKGCLVAPSHLSTHKLKSQLDRVMALSSRGTGLYSPKLPAVAMAAGKNKKLSIYSQSNKPVSLAHSASSTERTIVYPFFQS